MANGIKTGGRVKGTPNKPKVVDPAPPAAAAAPAARPGAAAPPPGANFTPQARGRAREAASADSKAVPVKSKAAPAPAASKAKVALKVQPPLSTQPPDPRIRMVPTESLVAHNDNARTHSPAQITKLANAIREFGFTSPILTDGKTGVLAGHGRLAAARQLGLTRVPTIGLPHLTAKQRRAYVIADNRLALDAEWDEDLLATVLSELKDDKVDLGLTGFDEFELIDLGVIDGPDEEPPAPRGTVTKTETAVCPKCHHKFPV